VGLARDHAFHLWHPLTSDESPAAVGLIAAFCGIAFWTCLELLVLVYGTFKRRTGLYFWSIIITTLGLILQTTGYLLKAFENTANPYFVTVLCKVGWVSNVTGFSVVLWSRLHLVVQDPRILRGVLIMIVINGLVLHTPIVVFEFGLMSRHRERFLQPMEIMERIQQTVFTLQEVIISGLYIFHTVRFLDAGFATRTRKVVALLISVQVLAISMDAGLTTFDFMNMFTLKCTLHPFVYSVKLKLEFIVLNQLLSIVKRGLTKGLQRITISDACAPDGACSGKGGKGLDNSGTLSETKTSSNTDVEEVRFANPVRFSTRGSLADVEAAEWQAHVEGIKCVHGVALTSTGASRSFKSAHGEVDDEENLGDVVGRPDEARVDPEAVDAMETGQACRSRAID